VHGPLTYLRGPPGKLLVHFKACWAFPHPTGVGEYIVRREATGPAAPGWEVDCGGGPGAAGEWAVGQPGVTPQAKRKARRRECAGVPLPPCRRSRCVAAAVPAVAAVGRWAPAGQPRRAVAGPSGHRPVAGGWLPSRRKALGWGVQRAVFDTPKSHQLVWSRRATCPPCHGRLPAAREGQREPLGGREVDI
jgi:hypothetical protein